MRLARMNRRIVEASRRQFADRPNMIRQPLRHGWRRPQRLVDAAEIVMGVYKPTAAKWWSTRLLKPLAALQDWSDYRRDGVTMRLGLAALAFIICETAASAQPVLPVEPFTLTTPDYPTFGYSLFGHSAVDCEKTPYPPNRNGRRGSNPAEEQRSNPACPTR